MATLGLMSVTGLMHQAPRLHLTRTSGAGGAHWSCRTVSGPIAALGKDEENGVRMALDELNARKLQLGGRRVQWKLEAGRCGDPGQAQATRFAT